MAINREPRVIWRYLPDLFVREFCRKYMVSLMVQ
jgi:hypothetical protein